MGFHDRPGFGLRQGQGALGEAHLELFPEPARADGDAPPSIEPFADPRHLHHHRLPRPAGEIRADPPVDPSRTLMQPLPVHPGLRRSDLPLLPPLPQFRPELRKRPRELLSRRQRHIREHHERLMCGQVLIGERPMLESFHQLRKMREAKVGMRNAHGEMYKPKLINKQPRSSVPLILSTWDDEISSADCFLSSRSWQFFGSDAILRARPAIFSRSTTGFFPQSRP